MTYLTLENLSKSFGEKVILNDVTFSIEQGQKIALVAKNGSGKSTLLRIIMGLEEQDKGKIFKKNGLKISLLDQDPIFNYDHTILESILNSDLDITKAILLYEKSLQDPEDASLMQDAYDLMEKYNAWDFEVKIKDILDNLKLTNPSEKVSNLSGGQKKRLAIAKILSDSPDLFIMDEPTNHLDLEVIDWLENYLINKNITLLMVTHDRYFLDRICNSIFELNNGNIYKYNGNYTYYLEKKDERQRVDLSTALKTEQFLKKESGWVSKMPQGRGSKSDLRMDNYYKMKQENSNLKSKINSDSKKLQISVDQTRLGNKILELHNLSKRYEDKVILDKFTYIFDKKEKIGIIGKNGVGKTTLLNIIMGLDTPDSGNLVTGNTVVFGYYTQHGIIVDDNETILNFIKNINEFTILSDGSKLTASQILERFLFPVSMHRKLISSLSGGEKRRLYLLSVLLSNPNFLILDEPTNDLDLDTINLLEEFLLNYNGCLIIVSHDRFFMDQIVDHLFVFEGEGRIKDFPGNYSDYRANTSNTSYISKKVNNENSNKEIKISTNLVLPESSLLSNVSSNSSLPFKKELSKEERILSRELEKEIKNLENKRSKLSERFLDTTLDYEQIRKMTEELKAFTKQIDEKTEKWLSLIS